MVDGDNTYPIDQVHALIAPLLSTEADMTIGSRIMSDDRSGFKPVNCSGISFFRM